MDGLRDLHLDGEIDYVTAPTAELDDSARVHSRKYLDELDRFCTRARFWGVPALSSPSTPAFPW